MLMGIWRVAGNTRLQSLAVGSISVFNSSPSGNKLVGIHNRLGMKSVSKFNGTLVVKSKLLKLVEGMLSVTGPTGTQKDGNVTAFPLIFIHRSACCHCAVSSCCPGLFNLYQVYMPLVHTQLMGLSNAGSCVGPVWGAVPTA
eukprot:1153289-Pelagomonas_calceolata.AAC.2